MTRQITRAAPGGPDMYRTTVATTAGSFEIEVRREWAPFGADRFHDLVTRRYFDDSRFFRAVAGKWVQFGIAGQSALAQQWRYRTIPDDTPVQSNTVGFVAFANTGPDTRATQVFINLGDNSAQNDWEPGFAPFGIVVSCMDVVTKLYSGYGETSGGGMRAGNQDAIFSGGNCYLDQHFPKLDRLISMSVTGA